MSMFTVNNDNNFNLKLPNVNNTSEVEKPDNQDSSIFELKQSEVNNTSEVEKPFKFELKLPKTSNNNAGSPNNQSSYVSKETQVRNEFVKFLRQFIGIHEDSGEADKFVYGNDARQDAWAWCAGYPSYGLEHTRAGEVSPWFKYVDNKLSVASYEYALDKAGTKVAPKDVKRGDIGLFDWEGDGVYDHVAVISTHKRGRIVTLDGNYSNMVKRNVYKDMGADDFITFKKGGNVGKAVFYSLT